MTNHLTDHEIAPSDTKKPPGDTSSENQNRTLENPAENLLTEEEKLLQSLKQSIDDGDESWDHEPLIPALRYFKLAESDQLSSTAASASVNPPSSLLDVSANRLPSIRSTLGSSTDTCPAKDAPSDEDIRLGKLLVDLSLVTDDLLQHAIEMALKLNIPVGRVLIMSGWLTDTQLHVAVQIQGLLKEKALSKAAAIKLGEVMLNRRLPLDQALAEIGHEETTFIDQLANDLQRCDSIKLGELFVASEIISEEALEEALAKARALGLPLGRVLMLSASVTPQLLETGVNAQRFVRQNKIKKEDAIAALKAAAQRPENGATCDLQQHKQPSIKNIRLGELLVLAGILSEQQIEYALEMGFLNNLPIGKVLIELGLISEKTIENALQLQKLVSNGSLNPLEAVYVLIDIHFHGATPARAISDNVGAKRNTSLQFTDYLVKSGVISQKAIEEAIVQALKNTHLAGRALLMTGALSETTLQSALRSYFYIQEKMLSLEEGVFIFDHCQRMGLSVEEMLEQLGWTLTEQKAQAEKVE